MADSQIRMSNSYEYLSYIKLALIIFMYVGESTSTVTMTLKVVKLFIIFSSHANTMFHVLTRDTTLKEDIHSNL